MTELSAAPPRIAIVDDDEDVRTALEALVSSVGYIAEAFENGDTLLGSERLASFSCVVTDLQMPGINGLTLARAIRRDHAMPIILITAFPAPGLKQQAAAAGVSFLLRKPFDPSALLEELDKLLR
ncbi:response regulator [Sphingomonas sp. MMS24-J13]|uniref:response regulator n=1 Tax=Sphingomonas sp. MMS24-J13 TaxID=3238686 RepID=UPI00384E5D92